MQWYVIYTRPKWELKVAKNLKKIGIETYCPTFTEIRQWSDRKKKISAPLFKSYVFVKVPKTNRNDVFQVPGVVRYLFWLNKPAVVKNQEIKTIKNWLNNGDFEEIDAKDLSQGDKLT